MADPLVVDANIELMQPGAYENAVAGEALARGDCVYQGADFRYYKVDVDNTLQHNMAGMAWSKTSSAGDPFTLLTAGSVYLGFSMTNGQRYYCSGLNDGKVGIFADLVSGDFVVEVGYATSINNLVIDINDTGTQIP